MLRQKRAECGAACVRMHRHEDDGEAAGVRPGAARQHGERLLRRAATIVAPEAIEINLPLLVGKTSQICHARRVVAVAQKLAYLSSALRNLIADDVAHQPNKGVVDRVGKSGGDGRRTVVLPFLEIGEALDTAAGEVSRRAR